MTQPRIRQRIFVHAVIATAASFAICFLQAVASTAASLLNFLGAHFPLIQTVSGRSVQQAAVSTPHFDARRERKLTELDVDTILIVETKNSSIHWMQRGDFDLQTTPGVIGRGGPNGISGVQPDGFCVGFADGVVWMLRHDTPYAVLERFFTVSGAKRVDRDAMLAEYRMR